MTQRDAHLTPIISRRGLIGSRIEAQIRHSPRRTNGLHNQEAMQAVDSS